MFYNIKMKKTITSILKLFSIRPVRAIRDFLWYSSEPFCPFCHVSVQGLQRVVSTNNLERHEPRGGAHGLWSSITIINLSVVKSRNVSLLN